VVLLKFSAGEAALLATLFDATALLVAYWGFRFGVLGVYMSGRTREKVCAVTGQDSAGVIGGLVRSAAAGLAGSKPVLK
jgi:hypothetical protein